MKHSLLNYKIMIPVIYLTRGSGLDSFLAYELEHVRPINMALIHELLGDMNIQEYPLKIIISNYSGDVSRAEYVFDITKLKYYRMTSDDYDIIEPLRKRKCAEL